jgi:hypothetical protein
MAAMVGVMRDFTQEQPQDLPVRQSHQNNHLSALQLDQDATPAQHNLMPRPRAQRHDLCQPQLKAMPVRDELLNLVEPQFDPSNVMPVQHKVIPRYHPGRFACTRQDASQNYRRELIPPQLFINRMDQPNIPAQMMEHHRRHPHVIHEPIQRVHSSRQQYVGQHAFSDDEQTDFDVQEDSSNDQTNRLYQHVERRGSNMGVSRLPPFNGRESWKVWYNRFTDVAALQGWNNHQKLIELLPRLQGQAGEFVYEQLTSEIRTNYTRLVVELNNRFRVIETRKTFATQFNKRAQKPNESAEDYAAQLKRLYDKAYANRATDTRREDLVRNFLQGLYDDRSRFHV